VTKKPISYEMIDGPLTADMLEQFRTEMYSVNLKNLVACHEQLLGQPLTNKNKEILSSL
jgi:hypothetical protein